MIQLENNEANSIIKALEEGTATEKRHAANFIERKVKEAEHAAYIAINESQSRAIKEQGVIEHLKAQEKLKEKK